MAHSMSLCGVLVDGCCRGLEYPETVIWWGGIIWWTAFVAVEALTCGLFFFRANPVLGFALDPAMDLGFEDNPSFEVARYLQESFPKDSVSYRHSLPCKITLATTVYVGAGGGRGGLAR